MLNIEQDTRRAWIVSFIALALVMTGLLGVRLVRGETLAGFTGGTTYRLIAENLVEHRLYSADGEHATGYRPPMYPFLLAGIRLAMGERAQVGAFVANLALDFACLAVLLSLVYRLSKSPRAMILAGLLFSFDIAFHLEAMAQRETMLYSLLLLAFLLMASCRDIGIGPLLAMACMAGLAWLTRPTGIALMPLLLIAAFFQTDVHGVGHRIARVCTACFIVAAIALPWQAYLYRSFDEPVLAGTTSGGLNLYQGNNPAADALIPYVDVDGYLPEIEKRLGALGLAEHDEMARDRWLKSQAMRNIRSQPGRFVRRACIKTLALYSPLPTPLGSGNIAITPTGDVDLINFKYHRSVWTYIITAHGIVMLGLLVIAFGKRRMLFSRRPRAVALIVGYILIVTLLHAITFAETRFRMPLDPLMIAIVSTALFARSPGEKTGRDTL